MVVKLGLAQTGPQPSIVKWSSIQNKAVRVIFPDQNLKEAERIANIIALVRERSVTSIGDKNEQIDLLVNTNTIQSNAYVTLMPYHSQFYATGAQGVRMGTTNWLDDLALHEYRHSLQFSNAKRGLTKLLYFLSGDIGWGAGMGLSMPAWFFEGDAVLSETIFSSSGRGRSPGFFEEQRALLLADKSYSYMQARNGSLKKLIPDHYPLGYTMVNYGRNHYGSDIWTKVLADAGAYKQVPYPLSQALKKYTGLSTKQLYKQAYQNLKTQWKKELDSLHITPTRSISPVNPGVITDYLFPHFLPDGSILCLKTSYQETTQLVNINHGKEVILSSIGRSSEHFLAVNDNQVTWTEIRKDGRRDAVEYSVVMSFDLASGVRRQLTHKTKYFSPSLSTSGNKLLAVEANQSLENRILVLDVKSGQAIQTIPNERNDFLSYPQWSDNESSVVYLARRDSKICMLKYELASGRTTPLTDWSSHAIGAYDIYQGVVYFNASFSGINNIYAVHANGDKRIYQISSVPVGADMPAVSPNGESIALTEQTIGGKQLSLLSLDKNAFSSSSLKVIEPPDMERYGVKTNVIEQNILSEIPKESYVMKKYSGILPGVKLHSWQPYLTLDSGSGVSEASMTLMMADILGNFSAELGPRYNFNEGQAHIGANMSYAKYFLPITANLNFGKRTRRVWAADGKTFTSQSFDQRSWGIGLFLPLSWYNGNYIIKARLNTSINHFFTGEYSTARGSLPHSYRFSSLHTGFTFSNIRNKAIQNINNKWSQLVQVTYQRSLSEDVRAERFLLNTYMTAIGLRKNHGLKLSFRLLKEQDSNGYLYEDLFGHARGYLPNLRDTEYVFSLDYGLPLLYPDIGFAGLAYCNRVRANLFYDYGKLIYADTKQSQSSIGLELFLDVKFLNSAYVTSALGFRSAYLLNKDKLDVDKKGKFEIVVTTNF